MCKPGPTVAKWLKNTGLAHKEICHTTQVCKNEVDQILNSHIFIQVYVSYVSHYELKRLENLLSSCDFAPLWTSSLSWSVALAKRRSQIVFLEAGERLLQWYCITCIVVMSMHCRWIFSKVSISLCLSQYSLGLLGYCGAVSDHPGRHATRSAELIGY